MGRSDPDVTLETDDRRLVHLFLSERRESAFRELYRRHTPALYRLATRLTGDGSGDAQDAVQQTWERAFQRLDRFRWESTLKSWLTGITINCCREIRRSNGRRNEIDLDAGELTARPMDAILVIDLEQAIRRLPDGYREVLVLHDVEGYTHNEIADLLTVEVGTSKSQLSRARGAVRAILAEEKRKTDERTHTERAHGFSLVTERTKPTP